jgi:hypothetical protein
MLQIEKVGQWINEEGQYISNGLLLQSASFFPQCPIAQGDLSGFLSYYTHFGHVMNTKEANIIDNKMHIYIYTSSLVSITLHNRTKKFVSSIVDLFPQIDRLSQVQQRKEKFKV